MYIPVVFGDTKAHTYPNGIYQNGKPYPNSSVAKSEPYQAGYANGSTVEFVGKDPTKNGSSNGSMSDYVVDEIIVYD